jgi:hypothetical protein
MDFFKKVCRPILENLKNEKSLLKMDFPSLAVKNGRNLGYYVVPGRPSYFRSLPIEQNK